MSHRSIDSVRLLGRIAALGAIGRDAEGRLVRLAASDSEKLGRYRFVSWLEEAGLEVAVDRIGNIFGIWNGAGGGEKPHYRLAHRHRDRRRHL